MRPTSPPTSAVAPPRCGWIARGQAGAHRTRFRGQQKEERRLITFGHGARHLVGTGLAPEVVEFTISAEIEDIAQRSSRTGNFWGRVQVGGTSIEYRAHTLPNGDIHVGTYYPI